MKNRRFRAVALLSLVIAFSLAGIAVAQQPGIVIPRVGVEIGRAETPQQVSTTLQLLFILTILSLAPAILVMVTSFTRIIVVLGLLRQALGTQQMPPNQVLIGLALFLTFFVMSPTYNELNEKALRPYLQKSINHEEAFERGVVPIREFMFRQTREKDLGLFVHLSKIPAPRTPDDVPTHVLIPAFMISELKTAFQIGFVIFIPFLIIDMVIASALMSMGMLMLPPIFISLPFKIILFVLADGWYLVVGSLVRSFS
ncbi:MAG: flagellar biosynthetic protein FliP [Candidatus Abyssobacteria bacterium SURF_17]|jgi:flagellar biosynthetic protein FliP|uniref:Flagellar biosynthetic protein FliP n=1 Tax=Candidatus Abyssobacteria bacterium SURF_17 TaxID=2093361 RepID=A0A419F4M3_9BACT|nr:MAG: flagellar biosynthetic protein FliP [Candidatus Abyssubacteria bacterium SURF_17]